MKFLTSFALLIICLASCAPAEDCPEGTNLIPMYGHIKKCRTLLELDKEFVSGCLRDFHSRDAAAKYYTNKGWDYFWKDDLSTAMKRFNQAWMLDSTSADVYWGFGDILGKQEKYEESIVMLERALQLKQTEAKIWVATAVSYNQLFFVTKDEKYLDKAIAYSRTAIQLEPNYANGYEELTVAYSYFIQKDSARKYLKITDKLDSTLIVQALRDHLK